MLYLSITRKVGIYCAEDISLLDSETIDTILS